MGYVAGVDLGTTYSAAAVLGPNGLRAVDLGTHSTVMPSVVAVRSGGEVLTGTNAERRLVSQPSTVAREFKRRLGDATPILLGGTPYATADLTGYLLASIIELITERQDEPPEIVGLSHPANFGDFKLDLLKAAARTAEVTDPVFVAEPVAAAVHYSQTERVGTDDVIAVYDLGGGTFDASVVRRTAEGFEMIGTPDGMDRFGGIDLDEAVLGHVRRSVDGELENLDRSDPAVTAALIRLRDDCREAKEALSGDAEVEIPVMLPSLHTGVRLTRPEFEDMIRPRVSETIDVLRRTIRSAGIEVDEVSRVLLVGGSSRIPLIGEMVTQELGKPVGLDAHPKLTVALGTARVAGGDLPDAGSEALPPIVASRDTAGVAGLAALATPEDAPTVPIAAATSDEPVTTEPATSASADSQVTTPLPVPPPAEQPPPASTDSGRPAWLMPAGIIVAVLLLVGGGVFAASSLQGDAGGDDTTTTASSGDVDVPSVTGREAVAARDTLAAAGLTVRVDFVDVDPGSPDDGFVVEQSIPAGTSVEPGTEIAIRVGRVAATTTLAPETSTTPPTSTSTSTSTTTSTTSTTTTPTTAPLTAQQQLTQLIEEDADLVAQVAENWLPQLSGKRLGLVVDEVEFGYEEILANHLELRQAYGAVLIDGGTYNFNQEGNQMVGWYMTLVPEPFVTFDGALDWCRFEDIGRDDCFAKFLSADPENVERTVRLQ